MSREPNRPRAPESAPHWLTAAQLAEILQVSRETIYREAKAGRLAGLRIGGTWRFPPPVASLPSRRPEEPENGGDKPKTRSRPRRGNGASGDLLRIGPKRRGARRG
jgi:excisionase family DNA binding protein